MEHPFKMIYVLKLQLCALENNKFYFLDVSLSRLSFISSLANTH